VLGFVLGLGPLSPRELFALAVDHVRSWTLLVSSPLIASPLVSFFFGSRSSPAARLLSSLRLILFSLVGPSGAAAPPFFFLFLRTRGCWGDVTDLVPRKPPETLRR
jgi:hypothetical protein